MSDGMAIRPEREFNITSAARQASWYRTPQSVLLWMQGYIAAIHADIPLRCGRSPIMQRRCMLPFRRALLAYSRPSVHDFNLHVLRRSAIPSTIVARHLLAVQYNPRTRTYLCVTNWKSHIGQHGHSHSTCNLPCGQLCK